MIQVYGVEKNLATKAIQFYCKELGIAVPGITLMINETLLPDQHGRCYRVYDDEYIIEMKSPELFDHITQFFETLAHEMVHIKQFIQNGLQTWIDSKLHISIPYKDQWWEQEAYGKQTALTVAFVEEIIKEMK